MCYYVVLYDYGFVAEGLFGMQSMHAYIPRDFDNYDPQDVFLGNSILRDLYSEHPRENFCDPHYTNSFTTVDFLYSKNAKIDLRNTFIRCDRH